MVNTCSDEIQTLIETKLKIKFKELQTEIKGVTQNEINVS